MKNLIYILLILSFGASAQFDGKDTLHCKFLVADSLIYSIDRDGWFNYSDSATQSGATPIAYTTGSPLKLTNDGKGGQTDDTYKPYNVVELFDTINSQFDFSELEIGDEVFIRFNLDITTSAVNQEYYFYLSMAIGGSFPYNIQDGNFYNKATGLRQIGVSISVYIGSDDTRLNPAELMFNSDANATITMNSIYISTKRRTQ